MQAWNNFPIDVFSLGKYILLLQLGHLNGLVTLLWGLFWNISSYEAHSQMLEN